MKNVKAYRSPAGPIIGIETDMRDIGEWRGATIAQIREAVMRGYIVGSSFLGKDSVPAHAWRFATPQSVVESIAESADEAVRAGRLIDFGHWTNSVIKYAANRGGPLYHQGAIGHPFSKPWVFVHTWDGGIDGDTRPATTVYVVNPFEPDRLAGGDCEALELQPITVAGERLLMISDQMLLDTDRNEGEPNYHKYRCGAVPSIWRFLPGMEAMNNGGTPESAAAGNVLDPLMTALLILSTRGVPRERIVADVKLQKARAKSGKSPIPPYERVMSQGYVTAIQQRMQRGRNLNLGGTHASPVAHLRMGHQRVYASGVKTWVRDALVNFTEESKKAWIAGNRSHYEVK